MLIEITQKDIDNGVAKKAASCPIAIAIRRQTKYGWARVGGDIWSIGFSEECMPLPPEATRFIRLFDSGEKVSPCTFTIQMPNE